MLTCKRNKKRVSVKMKMLGWDMQCFPAFALYQFENADAGRTKWRSKVVV